MSTAFVLPGGGSLGAVQVGMLQALAESGVEPDLLVGTSAGALNAAWVATHGTSQASLRRLADLWIRLRRADVFPIDARLVARGLLGRATGVVSPSHLQRLISGHLPVKSLEDTAIPVHILATDLLTGAGVSLSTGPIASGVLASAAIPGILPPVVRDGRLLIDGGVGRDAGIAHAVDLGASTVYVLPAGTACALTAPPRSVAAVAMQALTVLLQHRVESELDAMGAAAAIRAIPPLCPLQISPLDFGHAGELIERGHDAARAWIGTSGLQHPSAPASFAVHTHAEADVQSCGATNGAHARARRATAGL